MFTGLIQCTGDFSGKNMTGKAGKLFIRSHKLFHDLKPGESIAVNGTCLTLEEFSGDMLSFHVLKETFDKTSLGELVSGSIVNLERALAANDRLGGHIVSGHVDGTGKILSLGKQGDDTVLEISAEKEILMYIVSKGSIAVDGISLTVASVKESSFTICIIPTTWNETNLKAKKSGDSVNLETDMLGKYVYSFLMRLNNKNCSENKESSITLESLEKAGFF
ncbi:MAG: riboflavin synthase [Lentisphaeria bacterium]|nr:riboflavin synthase [Lentisphaeria bacterium]